MSELALQELGEIRANQEDAYQHASRHYGVKTRVELAPPLALPDSRKIQPEFAFNIALQIVRETRLLEKCAMLSVLLENMATILRLIVLLLVPVDLRKIQVEFAWQIVLQTPGQITPPIKFALPCAQAQNMEKIRLGLATAPAQMATEITKAEFAWLCALLIAGAILLLQGFAYQPARSANTEKTLRLCALLVAVLASEKTSPEFAYQTALRTLELNQI